jgi:hypothetical protein
METSRHSNLPLEKRLCILAREFRGTRNEQEHASIAAKYAEAVVELIKSKKWKRIPTPEDQLPDEWMPDQFFGFWSLRPPVRRDGRGRVG